VTDVVISVPPEDRDAVAAQLAARLDPARYEVMRWNDMFPVMEEWVTVQTLFEYFFIGVVLILVAAAVANVALVASLARRREFQVMLAIGQSGAGLRRLLMMESLLYGLLGCGAGLLLGTLLIGILSVTGVSMEAIVGGNTERYFVDPVLFPEPDLGAALVITACVFTANLAAGLYPAWRVGTLEPLAGVRSV
jgi:ABC-type lipoprotein release transport system permease subunit